MINTIILFDYAECVLSINDFIDASILSMFNQFNSIQNIHDINILTEQC